MDVLVRLVNGTVHEADGDTNFLSSLARHRKDNTCVMMAGVQRSTEHVPSQLNIPLLQPLL